MSSPASRIRWSGATDLVVGTLLLGAVPLFVAPTYLSGLLIVGALDLVVFIAWLLDRRGAAATLASLRMEWRLPAAASVGRAAALDLEVWNPEDRSLRLEAQPGWPASLAQPAAPVELLLPPRKHGGTEVTCHPLAAGDHTHEELTLRVPGPWGLAYVDADVHVPATLEVSPEVTPLPGRRRSRTRARTQGSRATRGRAPDGEKASPRLYQPGDSLRSVDWKASARRRDLVVREREPERQRRALVAVEVGLGMGSTRDGRALMTDVVAATLGLVRRLVDEGCSVSVLAYDDEVRLRYPEVRGRGALARLGRELAGLSPSAREADTAHLDAVLAGRRQRFDQVVLLSASPSISLRRELGRQAARWSRRHSLTYVRLLPEPPEQVRLEAEGAPARAALTAVRDLERFHDSRLARRLGMEGVAWVEATRDDLPAVLATLPEPGGRRRRRRGSRRG
jgi:uncharacterized protein (DUF58 family)